MLSQAADPLRAALRCREAATQSGLAVTLIISCPKYIKWSDYKPQVINSVKHSSTKIHSNNSSTSE